jgi:hypothetical protein
MRAALFPNNGLAPPRVPPTPEEARAIKRRCADALVSTIPAPIARILFATSDVTEMMRQAEEWLGVLDDAYMNKWMVFGIIELLVVRLIPELAEKGVVELMGERLG